MGDHAVVHFEIAGPDGKALQDFYHKLFGWTIDADNPMNYAVVFKMEDGIGGGLPQTHEGTKPNYVTFYVACGDDVGGVLKKAESMGATPLFGPDKVEGGDGLEVAAFNDPDGNFIGLVNGSPDTPPPVSGSGAPVTWFEVVGKDPSKIQDWYRELFDWEIDADNEMQYGSVRPERNGIGGGVYGMPDAGGTTVYVTVDDLDATLRKANDLGGKTVMEPSQPPGGPMLAQFTDPAGNRIGLLLAGSYGNN